MQLPHELGQLYHAPLGGQSTLNAFNMKTSMLHAVDVNLHGLKGRRQICVHFVVGMCTIGKQRPPGMVLTTYVLLVEASKYTRRLAHVQHIVK